MKHRIGLVIYESFVHACVLDLPGCIAGGRDRAEIDALLPLSIVEHIAWLRANGDAIEDIADWEVAEEVDVRQAAGGEFCFSAEREPLSGQELELLIQRMGYARADVLAAQRSLPAELLDWLPSASTVSSPDPWEPEPRSIRRIFEHVLQLEVYYRDGLRDGAAAGIFENVVDPAAERAQTIELLRSLSDADRSRVYHPVRPGHSEPDEWTVRKVVRRIISHERAHAGEIVQRRTWFLLGIPRAT